MRRKDNGVFLIVGEEGVLDTVTGSQDPLLVQERAQASECTPGW